MVINNCGSDYTCVCLLLTDCDNKYALQVANHVLLLHGFCEPNILTNLPYSSVLFSLLLCCRHRHKSNHNADCRLYYMHALMTIYKGAENQYWLNGFFG